jgi:type I restriction enzyme S subunit
MVDSELGLIPEGWEVKPLSYVCSRITDGSHWSPKTVDEGYPMASVKDMHNCGFHIERCRKISAEDYEKLVRNDCKPLKNDVLVAKDGSYLKHIFVIEKEIDMVILSSIALLRPNEKIISNLLSLYLLEPSIKARMAGYVSGAALPRIILKDFRNFLILVPPINFQNKFFDLAEPMILNCSRLIEKNVNLRLTRDLLLQKLISGEINVEKAEVEREPVAL